MNDHEIPKEVQAEIAAGVAAVQEEIAMIDQVDPNYNAIIATLEEAQKNIDTESKESDGYLFDRDEFVAALPHIVADQLDAIKNQQLPEGERKKLPMAEFAERFNRWFVFCDAVCNLGISCLQNKEALARQEYESVFRTLKLNKQFESTFLKPHGIVIEFAFKSRSIKERYKWLAMPCLIVKDEKGEEHKIAITPSPVGQVWWLEILIGFHSMYQWQNELLMDQEDYDSSPYSVYGDKALQPAAAPAPAEPSDKIVEKLNAHVSDVVNPHVGCSCHSRAETSIGFVEKIKAIAVKIWKTVRDFGNKITEKGQ